MTKRNKKILLTVLLGIVLLLLGSSIFFLHTKSTRPKLPKEMGITITKDCKILESYDDHDKFLGDGVRYLVLQYSNDQIEKEIREAEHWHTLPLSKNLETFLGRTKGLFENIYPDKTLPLPEKGYYFFMDRFTEDFRSKDNQNKVSFDDSKLLERHAYNSTLAIFDAEKNILYYYEIDT